MNLKYKNKEGISLKKVLETVSKNGDISKKDLTKKVKAKKSIDTLINKLLDLELIVKVKDGRSVLYTTNMEANATEEVITVTPIETVTKPTKSNKKKIVTTEEVSVTTSEIEPDKKSEEKESIDNIIVATQENPIKKLTAEINQADLDHLKTEMEQQDGKSITTILHKRNEKKPVKEHIKIDEIYKDAKNVEDNKPILSEENPYRFVLNFFTTVLNNELATPHFKRRDNYVVKSIYNKFKTICDKLDNYDTEQQHIPFYRAFTIDKATMTVKMYHIDMNRVIRGYHDLFKLNDKDKQLIFGEK